MGKPQVIEDPKRPAAGFVEDRNAFHSPEELSELREEHEALAKKEQRDRAKATKVSTFLKDNSFRVDKTWPFLFSPVRNMQLCVRYFFYRKNLAIDQFVRPPTKSELIEIEFKKKTLKANGIKYFAMLPENRLMDLADFI